MLDLVYYHEMTSSIPGLTWFVFCVNCTLLIHVLIINAGMHNGVL